MTAINGSCSIAQIETTHTDISKYATGAQSMELRNRLTSGGPLAFMIDFSTA